MKMEIKYRDHIKRYLVELCTTTICHPQLIARLSAQDILSDIDKQSLEVPMLTRFEKSKRLYEILETRSCSYHKLMLALKESKQTGALTILVHQCSSVVQNVFVHGDLNAKDENGETALFIALSSGARLAEIKELIALGADPKVQNQNGQTVLHRAAEKGALGVIKYFVSLGVDIMVRDKFKVTVLHCIVGTRKNFLEMLQYLVPKRLDVNAFNTHGETLLLLAARSGRTKLELETIVSLGGSWKVKDKEGRSVLYQLVETGNVEAVKYLISLGADVHERDGKNRSLIHLVANAKENFKETLNLLLQHNLDINIEGNDGDTVLFRAAAIGRSKDDLEHVVTLGGIWDRTDKFGHTILHLAVEGGNIEAVQYFVSLGADLLARTNYNSTVMHHVVHSRKSFTDIFKYLVEEGCDVNAMNNSDDSILSLAVHYGMPKMEIESIVDAGGDRKIKNKCGVTILHLAVEVGNMDVIEYLVSLGADATDVDDKGYNALHHSVFAKHNFSTILQFLFKSNVDINSVNQDGASLLHLAVKYGRTIADLETVINFGGELNQRDYLGRSVLHEAAMTGNLEALKYFISIGADIKWKDNLGKTLLHVARAAKQNFKQTFEFLLETKLDINAVDQDGNNVILLAARFGNCKEELETVIKFGCDWKHKNNFGQSVAHIAAIWGNVETLKYFISLGADVNARNNAGGTVLHMSTIAEQNFKQTLEVLLDNNADINAVDTEGCNVVIHAILVGKSKEDLERIVNHGGDWKHRDNFGRSVLHAATSAGNITALKYFISLGADVSWKDNDGRTLVHIAAGAKQNFKLILLSLAGKNLYINAVDRNGCNLILFASYCGRSQEDLETIVKLGGDWKHKTNLGESVLHKAAQGGNVEALKYFISLGADLKSKDNENMTVLHRAANAKQNFKETLEFLLEKNLDIHAFSTTGNNLILLAALRGRTKEELEIIVNSGCDWKHKNKSGHSVLHFAAEGGNLEALEYFISLGVDVMLKTNDGETVLHRCVHATESFMHTVEYLLAKNLNINTETHNGNNLVFLSALWGRSRKEIETIVNSGGEWKHNNHSGQSILHMAAGGGNVEALDYFISLGADINCKNNMERTLMHMVGGAKQNFKETLEILLKKNLDINAIDKEGNNLILLAVFWGRSTQEIAEIIKHGGDWTHRNNDGQHVLRVAVEEGNLEVLKYFISIGSDTKRKGTEEYNKLQTVATHVSENQNQTLTCLLNNNVDINSLDKEGNNLVLRAVSWGTPTKELKKMVKIGGNWKLKNNIGRSVLHLAAMHGNVEALKYFITLGADINWKDNEEKTVMHMIAHAKQNFKQVLEFLLTKNMDINAVDKGGDNLVLLSARWGRSQEELKTIVNFGGDWKQINNLYQSVLYAAAESVNMEALKYFISLTADFNWIQYREAKRLHMSLASRQNFTELFSRFGRCHPYINAINEDGESPLLHASRLGVTKECLETIVNCGGDWKFKSSIGRSVLHFAVENGNVEALKYFISLGANINWRDNQEKTMIHMVAYTKQNFNETLDFLLEKGLGINLVDNTGNSLVLLAAYWGRPIKELTRIVKLGGDWKHKNNSGKSVLHASAAGGNLDALGYFISLGADVNLKDNGKQTVLHRVAAAEQHFKQTLEFLLERKLDINAVDKAGTNLIHLAALRGRSREQLETIVNRGGDWEHKNNLGQSVLHLAAQGGNVEALKYFVSLGVAIKGKDNYKQTPLHMLRLADKNFIEALDVLVANGADVKAKAKGKTLFNMLRERGDNRKVELLLKYL